MSEPNEQKDPRRSAIFKLNADLKAQWAPYHGGKCFMLSAAMGNRPPCTCHLCLIDKLTEYALEKKSDT